MGGDDDGQSALELPPLAPSQQIQNPSRMASIQCRGKRPSLPWQVHVIREFREIFRNRKKKIRDLDPRLAPANTFHTR